MLNRGCPVGINEPHANTWLVLEHHLTCHIRWHHFERRIENDELLRTRG